MSTIKRAIRTSIRRTRYSMFEQKENDYIHTPNSKRVDSEERNKSVCAVPSSRQSAIFRRGSKVTRSVRDAVGSFRQKFKVSTRRLKPLDENATTPVHCTGGRPVKGARDVPLYSPFHIETPGKIAAGRVSRRNNIRTVVSLETPTRLKREVEALTANMQALATLTPTTLQARRKSPRAHPITNGSLKTPRSARRRIINSEV